MMKRLLPIAIILSMLMLLSVPGLAATQANGITPYLSFSGTTASCTATVRGSGKINATLELWQNNTLVNSWSASGTVAIFLHGTAAVAHGQTYTLTVCGTVGGVAIQATPVTKTCP